MSRKRQREVEDTALKDFNSKRPHYDLRHNNHMRQCCSLPQYDKRPCQHKYHLRPFEHRKPCHFFGLKHALHSTYPVGGNGDNNNICMKIKRSTDNDLRRNAHSYSINGHMARCSNSSAASGRQRTLKANHHKDVRKSLCSLKLCNHRYLVTTHHRICAHFPPLFFPFFFFVPNNTTMMALGRV